MADVPLADVRQYVIDEGKLRDLVEAAAGIANAIQVGVGSMIRHTMMESELRKALGLKPGELVNIPKHPSASPSQEKNSGT